MSPLTSAPEATSNCACATADACSGIRPRHEITGSDSNWNLTVHLPGVTKEGLSITDENGVLTVRGERAWKSPEGWTTLHRETEDAAYELALHHEGEIDVEKIQAKFADGVLEATLPKAEALKPRKIAIN